MRKYLAVLVLPLVLSACGDKDARPSAAPKPTHSVAEIADWAVATDRAAAWGGGIADWDGAEKVSEDYCKKNGGDVDKWAFSIAYNISENAKRQGSVYVKPAVTMAGFVAAAKFSCPERLSVVRKAVTQVKGLL